MVGHFVTHTAPTTRDLHQWMEFVHVRNYQWKRSGDIWRRATADFIDFVDTHSAGGTGRATLDDINQTVLTYWRDALLHVGKSASTVNSYLSAVHCFLEVLQEFDQTVPELRFKYVPRPPHRKWWLNSEDELRLFRDFLPTRDWGRDMRDYIEWARETGLRVEESLRVRRSSFIQRGAELSMRVPGTKTEGSDAVLPLSSAAAEIVYARMNGEFEIDDPDRLLFPISYENLRWRWDRCRAYLGVSTIRTSSLKSLRRTFAANCLMKGVPPSLIQELMRHTSLKTTMEYLRLIGLTDNPEVRRMLNRKGYTNQQLDAYVYMGDDDE